MIDTRCGLKCDGCEYKESCGCGGCIATEGHPFHGECPVARCCQDRGYAHCGECADIPCQLLVSYSSDPVNGDHPAGGRIRECLRQAGKKEKTYVCSSETFASDDLGRPLITFEQSGPRRENRFVGMFYFLWCGEHSDDYRPLDITKLLAADPKAGYTPDAAVWGAYGTMHHWGEPLFGYYYSIDEWVMRRHIELLTRADIDFLVFDTTNAVIYEAKALMMMRLLTEYRRAGYDTPKVVFYTNTASGKTAQTIYDDIYAKQLFPDTWLYVDGKPIIIARDDECSDEVRSFFTIRASQWPNEPTKRNGWPWMDFVRPQRVLENYRGEPEIINVSVAQHPQIRFGDSAMYGEEGNCGRSYHNGANDHSNGAYKYGYNFDEQWKRALDTDPPYVFVTGWNEWIAGRWGGTETRPLLFVDCCDLEYSRDIEPMRGGYFDNYYMQLISNVRRYKGCAEPVTAKGTDTVVYRDFPNGGFHRDCEGYDTRYENRSGRNEIIGASVSDDGENIVFTAECAADITKYDYHSTWMHLFIGIEGSGGPTCCSYRYMANIYQYTETVTSLAVCAENSRTIEADTFRICALLDYSFKGRFMKITVPKERIELGGVSEYRLYFKWADSRTPVTRMEDFYTEGDSAPTGRLNFVFRHK